MMTEKEIKAEIKFQITELDKAIRYDEEWKEMQTIGRISALIGVLRGGGESPSSQ